MSPKSDLNSEANSRLYHKLEAKTIRREESVIIQIVSNIIDNISKTQKQLLILWMAASENY